MNPAADSSTARILVLEPQPFYEDRGTPIAIQQVLEALAEVGAEVDLLTFPMGQTVEIPGLRTIRTANPLGFRHVPIGLSLKKIILDLLMFPKFLKQIRTREYSCIHAVEEAAFMAVLLKRWHGIPVVYDMASCLPEQLALYKGLGWAPVQRIFYLLERWLVQRVDLVVCSKGLAAHVREIHPSARVEEWQYPVRKFSQGSHTLSDLVPDLEVPEDVRIILYSGNFEDYQGVPMLLEAMRHVSRELPKACLILVGDDRQNAQPPMPYEEELREEGVLRILPRQPREVAVGMLSMADVLVLPRQYGHNLPLKVFEYLASGRPIVAVDLPCYQGVLDPTRAALAQPDPADLGDAILKVLRDPDWAAEIGRAGREFAESRFGWANFVEQISEFYRSVGAPIGR